MYKIQSNYDIIWNGKNDSVNRHTVLTIFLAIYVFWQIVNGLIVCTAKAKGTFWFSDVVFSTILPTIIILLSLKKYKWKDIGFKQPNKGDLFDFIGFTAGVALFLPIALNILSGLIPFDHIQNIKYSQNLQSALDWFFPKQVLILYLSITAGFFEEIIYKGIIIRLILSYTNISIKIVIFITSSIFAIVHWEQGVTGISIAFSYSLLSFPLYRRYGNLLPVIIGHTLYDYLCYVTNY